MPARLMLLCLLFYVSLNAVAKDFVDFSELDQMIPSIQALGTSPQALALLTQHDIAVLQTNPQKISSRKSSFVPDENIQLTQAFTVIHAPLATVRAQLLDFNNYSNTMPHIRESKVQKQDTNNWIAEYELSFKMPLVTVRPNVTVQHTLTSKGDLLEAVIDGDMDYSIARWELLPITPGSTLVAQTAWADVSSVSWIMSLVFAVQPDLRTLSPITAAALTLQSLRQDIEQTYLYRYKHVPTIVWKSAPYQAVLTQQPESAVATLEQLTKHGIISLIAPLRVSQQEKQRVLLQQVQTFARVAGSLESHKPAYTNIRQYAKGIKAIKKISAIKEEALKHQSQWHLGFDFSIFSMGIEFDVMGQWNDEKTQFDFYSPKGDFLHLAGQWQWFATPDQQTMVMFSSSHDIDPEAGIILKAIRQIPFNQMFSGLFIGHQLVRGQVEMLGEIK